ncbi:MAG TPA: hypothetical protein VHK91_09440, partial [Flavisolibacter sp.]|nr:hypothetical protein [Flavisolibacter sp.]
ANGNLFRSSSTARIGSGAAPAQEIESLKKELADLKAEVEILKRLLPEASIMPKFSFTINHPNPFNASTRIDYKIPETYNYSSGSIKVIDVNGNLVRQFPLSGNRTGQFQFVPQGNLNQTFIYSLELDGKVVESKKMIRSGN